MTNINKVLDLCLARIERGELSVEECLALYPELSAELHPLLEAGSKLNTLKGLRVRPDFRTLNRGRLLDHMQAHPRRKSGWGSSIALRYAIGFAALTLAFVTAGTALAQQALPGDALYSWKLASERLWRSLQRDRVEADLTLADRRVFELNAIQGMPLLEAIGMSEYADQLLELRADVNTDPSQTQWVNETLLTHEEALRDFFANSEIELPDPEELFDAIPWPPEPELPSADEEDETDSNLDLPLVVPPVKKNDEQEPDSDEDLLEEVIDELLGLP